MTYPLAQLVSVWMSLYPNLPRIKKWALEEKHERVSIGGALHYLTEDCIYAGPERTLLKNTQRIFKRFRDDGCTKTVEVLEKAWTSALSSSDFYFDPPTKAVSLTDFPRYYGAVWPHNDVAVYLPELRKTAVMRMSDSRFEPLRKKLATQTFGLNPFIGTRFTIAHSKLHPVFNRIRCSRAEPIDPSTFSALNSFTDLLQESASAYVSTDFLKAQFQGRTPLALERYIIARYGSSYALMHFVVADLFLTSAQKSRDYNYTLKLQADGMDLKGWMFRNSLFDPVANPERMVGSKIRVAAFAVIGTTSLEEYNAHLHIIALHKASDLPNLLPSEDSNVLMAPLITEIESEILAPPKTEEYLEPPEIIEELDQAITSTEEIKPVVPKFIICKESDLSKTQGRILSLLASNKSRGFRLEEILSRLTHENLKGFNQQELTKELTDLCSKDLVFENVFRDRWQANPLVKFIPAPAIIPQEMIEDLITTFLRDQGTKIKISALVNKILTEDRRLKRNQVTSAINALRNRGLILEDKINRCWLNPSPPRSQRQPPAIPVEHRMILRPVMLTEAQIGKLLGFVYPQLGTTICIYRNGRIVKNLLVLPDEYHRDIIKVAINEIKNGKESALEFSETFGGKIRISKEKDRLIALYWNRNAAERRRFMARVRGSH